MFIQSCFIRKNTKYLIDKLEELGYNYAKNGAGPWFIPLCESLFLGVNLYSNGYYMGINGKWGSNWIDCGTNEELFLAIAALRNDTDKNQWFVIPKIKTIRLQGCFPQTIGMDGHQQIIDGYKWHLSNEDGISEKIRSYIENGEDEKFLPHKATVKELIEHFK